MNLQSSSNYFPIKNLFNNHFLWFYYALDWASIKVKRRGLGVKFCRHREQWRWMAGWFLVSAGVLLQKLRGEEVWDYIDRPIINQPLGSDPTCNEPVRARIRPMQDRRPRFTTHERIRPHRSRPFRGHPTAVLFSPNLLPDDDGSCTITAAPSPAFRPNSIFAPILRSKGSIT
jgi:hypothetical protein